MEDAFNREIPLYAPRLEIDEEFVVVRAKRRPVILIAPRPEIINVERIRGGGKVNLNLCVVAPLYSIIDKEGFAKYSEQFVNRIRRLEFPNLFFIPENKENRIRYSICRLDCFQVCFTNHLEAMNICLSDEVLSVFQGQINFYLNGIYEGDYKIYRECLVGNNENVAKCSNGGSF